MKLFLSFFISLVVYMFSYTTVFAVEIVVKDYPTSKITGEEFVVRFDAEGLSPGTYYGKVRIGAGSSLNKAETKNGVDWFGDTSSWSGFPSFAVDESGVIISGELIARAKNSTESGEYSLLIRLNNGSNHDSPPVLINLEQAPTPTLTPTKTPIPTKTPKPTKAPSPTKVPTATKIPTITKAQTSTNSPTAIELDATGFDDEEEVEVDVLGDVNNNIFRNDSEKDPDTKERETVVLGASNSKIPWLFIGLGLIFIAVCAILSYLQFGDKLFIWKKNKLL